MNFLQGISSVIKSGEKMKNRDENGIISLFVIFSMILLLTFVITSYFFIKEKIKIKENENIEIEKLYSNLRSK